jgi:uncharacterized protein (UPF0212 family)
MSEQESNFGEFLASALIGLAGGVVVAAILSAMSKPKCPYCQYEIEKGMRQCPNCNNFIQWR